MVTIEMLAMKLEEVKAESDKREVEHRGEMKMLKEMLSHQQTLNQQQMMKIMELQQNDDKQSTREEKKEKVLAMKKNFLSVPKYSGKPVDYEDWKFKMKLFLSEEEGYVAILREIEKLKTCPTTEDINRVFEKAPVGIDKREVNKQLYRYCAIMSQTVP